MRKTLKAATVGVSVVLAVGVATPAFAAPGDNGRGVGGCVDTLYGNATNPRESGHGTLPSLSPGPHTMAGGFFSMGDALKLGKSLTDAKVTGIGTWGFCPFP